MEMDYSNSCLYFYCINNGINPLTILVDLSRVPPIIKEGRSYVELPKELWDRTKQIGVYKRAILSKSHQFNASYTAQLGRQEQSYLVKMEFPHLPSRVYSKGKECI